MLGFFDNPVVDRQMRKEPVNLEFGHNSWIFIYIVFSKALEEFQQEISLDLSKADDVLEDLEIRKFQEEDKKAEQETM